LFPLSLPDVQDEGVGSGHRIRTPTEVLDVRDPALLVDDQILDHVEILGKVTGVFRSL